MNNVEEDAVKFNVCRVAHVEMKLENSYECKNFSSTSCWIVKFRRSRFSDSALIYRVADENFLKIYKNLRHTKLN